MNKSGKLIYRKSKFLETLPIFGKTDLPSYVSQFTVDDVVKCLESSAKQNRELLIRAGILGG